MKIIIDNREKFPFSFAQYKDVIVERGTLPTGDYTCKGTDCIIERKAIDDLIGCLTTDRDRFTRELERLRGYASALLIVESSYNDIRLGRYHSRMSPLAAEMSVLSIMQKYRLPFMFAGNHVEGARIAYHFFRMAHRHAVESLRELSE